MAQNPTRWTAPRLLSGPVNDAFKSLSRWLNMRLVAASGTAAVGIPPTVENDPTAFQVQAGTVDVVLNGSSLGDIVFPAAFPSGVLAIVVTAVDSATIRCDQVVACTTTTATIKASAGSVTRSFSYIVIGW